MLAIVCLLEPLVLKQLSIHGKLQKSYSEDPTILHPILLDGYVLQYDSKTRKPQRWKSITVLGHFITRVFGLFL